MNILDISRTQSPVGADRLWEEATLESALRALDHPESEAIDWLRVVQETAEIGIWDWWVDQPAATCTQSNPVLYGLAPSHLMPPQEDWLALIHAEDRERVRREMESALAGESLFQTEFRVVWPDGAVRWLAGKCRPYRDRSGKPVRMVGVNYDITRLKETEIALRQSSEMLQCQGTHDALTGLPNRHLLQQRIREAIDRAGDGGAIAVLYIDLDEFKLINESLGHGVGDELLRVASRRLAELVQPPDTIGRTGGDEFMVVLNDIAGKPAAESAAERILAALGEPFQVDRHELFVTGSIGISMFPEHGREEGLLQQNADLAMYRAKRTGKNAVQFFAAEMTESARERLELGNHLRHALERGEFVLHYQPLHSLHADPSGTIALSTPGGVEALLRWRHPNLGMISPSRFIPLAEETGLIVPIGAWVLDQALRDMRLWRKSGYSELKVSVNVSGLQFVRPDFVAGVKGGLERHGLPAACLGIELTESVLMGDFEECSRKINELKEIGVTTSIDDFGTGYSSLGYLQSLPIHALKIDGSFVRAIGNKPRAMALIQAIVSLAHNLDMRVVVECIETQGQLDAVRSAGCDEAQGYFLKRPVPADSVLD